MKRFLDFLRSRKEQDVYSGLCGSCDLIIKIRHYPAEPHFYQNPQLAKIQSPMKKRHLLAGLTGAIAGAVAVKLLARPRDAEWPDSINFIYYPEHSWFTTVNGVRIHYQEAGAENAPAMILIPKRSMVASSPVKVRGGRK